MNSSSTNELLIYRWINGFFASPADLETELKNNGICCGEGYQYQALLFRIDHYRQQRQRMGMEKLYQLKTEILSLCGRLFRQGYSCIGSDTYVVTILVHQGVIRENMWSEAVDSLRKAIHQQFDVTLTVAVGTHSISASGVTESVRNAYIAARYRMVFGPEQTIHYEDISMRVGIAPLYPENESRAVLRAFERQESAEFEKQLSLLFTASYSQSVQFGLIAAEHLLMELYRVMPAELQDACDIVGIYTQLNECEDLYQQQNVLLSFGLRMIDERHKDEHPDEKRKAQMEEILEYVKENYSHPDLSMTSIAEHAGLSANTVRQLFREHGLASPKDYIQKLRMDEACRLLVETRMTAGQIGEKVGYLDSRYFYVSFKKYTGKTAFEYRAAAQK